MVGVQKRSTVQQETTLATVRAIHQEHGSDQSRSACDICQQLALLDAAPEMIAWLRAFVATLAHHDAEVKLSFHGSALNGDILDALREARALLARIGA